MNFMIPNYFVPTGTIIKEYIIENGYTQKEICTRLNVSEKHLSNLLNGNSRLTEEMAIKFETIFPSIPASYWLNLESKYREILAREEHLEKLNSIDLQAISKRFRFSEVFSGLDWDLTKQAQEMLKLLKISDFENFDKVYSNMMVNFMEDGGEKEAIAIWLNLCESEIEIQNKDLLNIGFSKDKLTKSLPLFKKLSLNSNTNRSFENCKTLCNKLGIYLVIVEPITNSKVRGALTTKLGHPTIYLSGRFKTHDHIWFAFVHEIAHLIKHYNCNDIIVSSEDNENEKIEQEANMFARDFFVNSSKYDMFKNNNDISVSSIVSFAKSQNILPGIVVAFLQHDGVIGFDEFNNLKNRFDINTLN